MNEWDQQAEYVGLRYETKKMIVSYILFIFSYLRIYCWMNEIKAVEMSLMNEKELNV